MDILLRTKYTYHVPHSFEHTKEKLLASSKSRWDTFSSRLPEIIDENGNFSLRSNFSLFFNPVNYGQTIYLTGKIEPDAGATVIHITLRPNFALIFAFYLLPTMSLNTLFGDNSLLGSNTSRLNNIMVLATMELAILVLVMLSSYFIKRKFEKAVIGN